MDKILKTWLTNRIGLSFDIDNKEVGPLFCDGTLFCKLLGSYNIVDPSLENSLETDGHVRNCEANIKQLSILFQYLGINLTDSMIEEIANGDSVTCIHLLHELFISLDSKENWFFVTKKKVDQLLFGSHHDLKVTSTSSQVSPIQKKPETRLELPLLKRDTLTNLFKEKYNKVLEKLERINEPKVRSVVKELGGSEKEVSRGESTKVMNDIDDFMDYVLRSENEEDIQYSPREYIDLLKLRRQRCDQDQNLKVKTHNALLDELWGQILKSQEEEFQNIFSKKLIQQSQFERQLAHRLSQLHDQKRVFDRNRKQIVSLASAETEPVLEEIKELLKPTEEDALREKKRILELHKTLYAERMRQRYQGIWNMCQDIMDDILNYAFKISDFHSKYFSEPPKKFKNNWKELFYVSELLTVKKEQQEEKKDSILEYENRKEKLKTQLSEQPEIKEDVLQKPKHEEDSEGKPNLEDDKFITVPKNNTLPLENYDTVDLCVEELAKIGATFEIESKNQTEVMNKKNVEDYLNSSGPWNRESWMNMESMRDPEHYVLSQVISRLLETKYPFPPSPAPAGVTMFPIRAVLLNLVEGSMIQKLRAILLNIGINLIQITDVINYCLLEYLSEIMGPENIAETKKKMEKLKDTESDYLKELQSVIKLEEEEPQFKDVGTQHSFESKSMTNRTKAPAVCLGKTAYEQLTNGNRVSDHLIVKMLVEFIMSHSNNKGWVLLNYPVTPIQLQLIEYTFTGSKPPINADETLDDRDEKIKLISEFRTTRLLKKRVTAPHFTQFCSYFTHFIVLPKLTTKSIVEEERQNEKLLFDFYEKMGILTSISSVPTITEEVLLKICGIIIGNGEELELLIKPRTERGSEALPEEKSIDGTDSDDATARISNDSRDLETNFLQEKIEEEVEVVPETESLSKSGSKDDLSKTSSNFERPLEICMFPIPEDIQIALATLWEQIEFVYIENITEFSYLERTLLHTIFPFKAYVKVMMEKILNVPDCRQEIVSDFQYMLINQIPDGIRSQQQVKGELHCRVYELQNKLWEICDSKKAKAEEYRQEIIKHNWLSEFLHTLSNLYTNIMQSEVNRYIETLQLVNSYYFAALNKNVTEKCYKISVPKIKRPETLEQMADDNRSLAKMPVKKNAGKSRKSGKFEKKKGKTSPTPSATSISTSNIKPCQFHPSIVDMLIYADSEQKPRTSLDGVVSNICDSIINEIHIVKAICFQMLNKEATEASDSFQAAFKFKDKGSSKPILQLQNYKMKDKLRPNENIFSSKRHYMKEWRKILIDESERVLFRLNLIKVKIVEELQWSIDQVKEIFFNFYNNIIEIYKTDMANIESLCRILKTAIEEETVIVPQIIMEQEKFYIDKRISMIPKKNPPLPVPIRELDHDFVFTIEQLTNLMTKFKQVAPLGVIQEPLIDILMDMAYFGNENGYQYLPKGWSSLKREDYANILYQAFGESLVVNWKDFILFGLNMNFPTEEDILQTRNQFLRYDENRLEVICYSDYQKVDLWFTNNLGSSIADDLRNVQTKELLFKLYEINKDEMNYSSLLLSFCKDPDPLEGFAKALSLVIKMDQVLSDPYVKLDHTDTEDSKESIEQETDKLSENVLKANITEEESEKEIISSPEGSKISRNSRLKFFENILNELDPVEEVHEELIDNEVFSITSSFNEQKYEVEETKWSFLVPFNVALTLLVVALQFYVLSPENDNEIINLENSLHDLYEQKGEGGFIKASLLIESDVTLNLFVKYSKFRSCSISQMAQAIVEEGNETQPS